MSTKPGGEISKRDLYFIWLVDCSSSMYGEKIDKLNKAIMDSIPSMKKTAKNHLKVQMKIKIVKFASEVKWMMLKRNEEIPVEDFYWERLEADGSTRMGGALSLVAEFFLKLEKNKDVRGIRPILVLITDGNPTDNFDRGLNDLLSTQWGKKSVRVAIRIGEDANEETLESFIGEKSEIPILTAENPKDLVEYIKWASTDILESVSATKPIGPPSPIKDNNRITDPGWVS